MGANLAELRLRPPTAILPTMCNILLLSDIKEKKRKNMAKDERNVWVSGVCQVVQLVLTHHMIQVVLWECCIS